MNTLCRRALFFILGTVSVAQAGPDPAEDLLAAHRAGDPAAIGRIARTLRQDPWPIALELLARRAPAAAAAFAQALPKTPDLAGLGAWVEAARVRKDLVGGYALLGELRAEAREQKFADLVRRTDELSGGDPVLDSMLLLLRAAALAELGRWPESLACHKAAAVRADGVGWLRGAAGSLAAGAGRARAAADHRAAIDIQNQLRAIHVRRGDRMAAAIALANRATHHLRLGDYRPARALLREAIPVFEQHHATGPAAIAHSNLGLLLGLSGEYAAAFRHTEHALAMRRKAGDVRGVTLVRGYLATLYARAGETDRALQTYGQVLAEHNERGDRARAAEVLGNRGIAHQARGDFSNALTDYRAAEALYVQLGDKSNARRARSNVAYVLGRNSEPEAALRIFERVLKEARLESDLGGVVTALEEIAQLQGVAGNWSAAASRYRAVVEAARGIGWRERTVRALQGLAQAVLNGGDAQEALRTARVARKEMQFLVGGLDDGLGATARAPRAGLFQHGARAAYELGDTAAFCEFLEAGRAGALLESLKGRDAIWAAAVPAELRAVEAEARTSEAIALAAYRAAQDSRKRKVIRARRAELERARTAVEDAVARIRREAKAGADLLYPEPDPVERIRKRLRPDQALVTYTFVGANAAALIVEPARARIVTLGDAKSIRTICRGLRDGLAAGKADEVSDMIRRMRDTLIAPLQIPDAVRTLLVSSEGELAYAPWAAIAAPRDVACVPSATVYGVLMDGRHTPGKSILAVGDPDYAGVPGLSALPASRAEAVAVGSTVLVGKAASETNLRRKLAAGGRLRALHVACHGIIDSKRPLRSALALAAPSKDGPHDGLLTAEEIFGLSVPADLVVLSACESGRGRIVEAEGIVGLTRAFFFAGAPRVIVSLWKVDDEATRALMVKFYELWNPKSGKSGLPTATALRKAQEFVRGHEKWKHPYYWAAWQLWGLGD